MRIGRKPIEGHLFSVVILSILKGELCHSAGSFFGDQFDGLNNAVDNLMLDTRVFTFCVLSDSDDINVVIESFVTLQRTTRSYICIKIKLPGNEYH